MDATERWWRRSGAVMVAVGAVLAVAPATAAWVPGIDPDRRRRARLAGVALVMAGAHLVYHRGIRPVWV